jgi:hypothetical protein
MGKRLKFIIMLYAFSVFIVSFIYVPYTRFLQGGAKTFLGHHLRWAIRDFWGIEWKFATMDMSGNILSVSIDSQLIIAEVLALTAIVAAAILVLHRK